MHPDEMLADMTAAQFEDWWELHLSDPWGDARADYRAARQVWATIQVHTKRRVREKDYLLKFRPHTSTAIDAAQYKRRAMMRYEAHNAAMDAIEQQRGGRKTA